MKGLGKPKDMEWRDYALILEDYVKKLAGGSLDAELYRGILNQLGELAGLMNNPVQMEIYDDLGEVIKVEEVNLLSYKSLSQKDDKAFDRFMVLLDRFPKIYENRKILEERMGPALAEALLKEADNQPASGAEDTLIRLKKQLGE